MFGSGWIIAVVLWIAGNALECKSADASAGVDLFKKYCLPCYGKDGRARTPVARVLGVKDLTKSTINDAEIAKQIREGRKDAAGKQKMPAFEDKFSAEEIDTLVAFVKKLRPRR